MKSSLAVLLLAACWSAFILPSAAADGRSVLAEAVVTEDATRQIELVNQLAGATNEVVARALAAWRISELFLHETTDGVKIPFLLDPQKDADDRQKGVRLLDGEPIVDERGQPLAFATFELVPADTTSRLRRAIKTVLDLFAVANPNPRMRRDAVTKLGQERNPDLIPHLEARLETETDPLVTRALIEAIALTKTVNDDPAVRIAAIEELGTMRSLNGLMFLKDMEKEQHTPAGAAPQISAALRKSVLQIENHLWWGNLVGTAFRGFATAAVLLVAALGLAITFGLMGVINMAHGEIIMVGAYTAFVTQNIFKGWFGNSGLGFDSYFLVALAASFVVAASVGLILERGIIRFLYKRPLESLLATWGVSLVLQQVFRHIFGAANVQVDAPSFLSGSFAFNGSPIGFNRIFIIGFAVFIVFATWLLLTRTSLGLQIRAVMQNRAMAACVGVRTDRVNMMTFAFGSGLAGMAGACLSQIGNVGPSLGQNYIVDCFMIVVLGGVGNLVGTVSASMGVGVTNQLLEPWLGAVLGKIVVLSGIILFLQWRPSGLFATRSRSLDG
ncbi:MAG TPA: urea ABC transporter permease subunit UrtB [Verrucomicrobiae bacterium]|nr:urea ABC transporter permease subunit UrtB [Verrucomicrobiae bacterium]